MTTSSQWTGIYYCEISGFSGSCTKQWACNCLLESASAPLPAPSDSTAFWKAESQLLCGLSVLTQGEGPVSVLSAWWLEMAALLLDPEIWLRQVPVSVLALGLVWTGSKQLWLCLSYTIIRSGLVDLVLKLLGPLYCLKKGNLHFLSGPDVYWFIQGSLVLCW